MSFRQIRPELLGLRKSLELGHVGDALLIVHDFDEHRGSFVGASTGPGYHQHYGLVADLRWRLTPSTRTKSTKLWSAGDRF